MTDYTIPDKTHSALLTVDVQCDTTLKSAPFEIPGTLEAVPRIQRLVQEYRKRDFPIIHVVRLYREDGSNVDLCRRAQLESGKQVLVPGTDGAELMDELKPKPGIKLDSSQLLSGILQQIGLKEWIMYKPRWGAFYGTHLEEHLHALKVNTVVVSGCNFPNCPRTTIYEASERDFKIVLVNDATSLIYDVGVQELKNIGVRAMGTDQCVAWLEDSPSGLDL